MWNQRRCVYLLSCFKIEILSTFTTSRKALVEERVIDIGKKRGNE